MLINVEKGDHINDAYFKISILMSIDNNVYAFNNASGCFALMHLTN